MGLTWRLDGSCFIKKDAIHIREDFFMKPINIDNSAGFDRMATWNEVRCAMSVFSHGINPLKSVFDEFIEVDSDIKDRAGNLSEDAMWLAIVKEMPDSKSN
jgi:hypothetical protein